MAGRNFFEGPAIKIEQPLGEFFVVSIKAKDLLEVADPEPARVVDGDRNKPHGVSGSQRWRNDKRIEAIRKYIGTVDAAFPNSIILAANYDFSTGNLIEDDSIRWYVRDDSDSGQYRLVIPTDKRMASLIDGQHRLFGFEDCTDKQKEMDLLCAIYLDLPLPYHAYIFATINYNQKSVDRSLAFQLFGYNLDEKDAHAWSPETFAVNLARIYEHEENSPFYERIRLGLQEIEEGKLVKKTKAKKSPSVSLATVVDGIMSLISSDPIGDRDVMHKKTILGGRTRSDLSDNEKLPLRGFYKDNNDEAIYQIILNFFTAADKKLWVNAKEDSFIWKTVGVQALFAVLKNLLLQYKEAGKLKSENCTVDVFSSLLEKVKSVDFSDDYFQASGQGKTRIKNIVALGCGLITSDEIKDDATKSDLLEVLGRYGVVD